MTDLNTKDEKFEVTVKGAGIKFTRKVSSSQSAKIIAVALGTEDITATSDEESPKIKVSPREFLNEHTPRTNPQKILTLGAYLRDILDYKTFSSDEIKTQLERAKEPIPSNFSRDVGQTVQRAWIAESNEEPGKYFITARGDEALKSRFKGTTQHPKRTRKRSSKRGKKQATTEIIKDKVKKLELTPTVDKYPNYWKILKKKDRILWLLGVAKERGVNVLTQKEIEFLADKLDDKIPQRSITGLIKPHKKFGFIIVGTKDGRRTQKITPPGLDHLRSLGEGNKIGRGAGAA